MPSKTREILLEVARQLFVSKGAAHTTMDDIATAASRGRRTIYTYFKNKREIYNAVLESESDHLVSELMCKLSAESTAEGQLRVYLHHLVSFPSVADQSVFKSLLSLNSRRLSRINKVVTKKYHDILCNILDQGCESGTFDSRSCRRAKNFLKPEMFHFRELLEAAQDTQGAIGNDAADDFVEFVISGLLLH